MSFTALVASSLYSSFIGQLDEADCPSPESFIITINMVEEEDTGL